jgi:hypothetical protein
MKISTDNLQNRPLVDFRWGFWGGILFDFFLQNGSQNWAARIYATVGEYCIGCEGVGAYGNVVVGTWCVGAW